MRGDVSRLIFLDSSVNTHGDSSKVICPTQAFSVASHERMSLTLQSFSMRRNWYNINPTNNTGYLFVNSTHYEFSITPGVYSSFTALGTALQAAIAATITDNTALKQIVDAIATVAYSAVTRKFTLTFTMGTGHSSTQVVLRTYHIKPGGTLPTGVSQKGGYSDLHEILGCTPIRVASTTNSMTATSTSVLESPFVASLNTLDAIYIHLTTLQTGNWMSTGHESHIPESLRLVESSLFARIPFDDSSFTETHEVVQFEDNGGDAFQSMLNRKSLDNLEIRVTDMRGRTLATMNPSQAEAGLMGFRMCLRWDVYFGRPPAQPQAKPPIGGIPPLSKA